MSLLLKVTITVVLKFLGSFIPSLSICRGGARSDAIPRIVSVQGSVELFLTLTEVLPDSGSAEGAQQSTCRDHHNLEIVIVTTKPEVNQKYNEKSFFLCRLSYC